jgi:hypothetical protein
MFSGPSITRDFLQGLARSATTDFLANGTPLTEAVVKQASSVGTLTAEHVRRICEMTYHDTYERMHKQASSADRYVVFDPPDPLLAAEMLNAEKVATARPRKSSLSGSLMTEKTAGARRPKFQAANAFDELMKTAGTNHDDAYEGKKLASRVQRLDTDLREAVTALRNDIESVKAASALAWMELTKVAYATYKDGHSLEEVLHAGFSGMTDEVLPHEATKVASNLAEFLAGKLEKTAGLQLHHTQHLGDIDPEHPLPNRFNKMAALETQRAHLEIALDDLTRDRKFLNEEISETLFGDKSASIRHISTASHRST